jgi:hypothetical protein
MDAEDPAMKRLLVLLAFLLGASSARAHVGSPDVYAEGQAGPYRLSIVIRPPLVIPGVAEIEVRSQTPGIDRIRITPVPLLGEAAHHPPVPDTMQKPSGDSQFYTGQLWIMETGSWQIRFAVDGAHGAGMLSIPLPATAMATRKMQPGLGLLLAGLGCLLVLGMIGIVGAATREAKLPPGETVPPANRRRAAIAMSVTFAILVAALILGNVWWKSEASSYSSNIYKPLQMTPALLAGNVLDLKLRDPGWISQRKLDDFIPDHNHLMHLYLIRWPQMDVVYHLHPEPTASGEFQLPLPSLPAGDYHLYADVVHAQGFPETIVGTATFPAISGRALAGDDAEGAAAPVNAAASNAAQASVSSTGQANSSMQQRFPLPDGYTMVWNKPRALTPKTPIDFQFVLLDPQGRPPADMGLYMGMLGHAAFVKTDGTVFAHIHPSGTMAMAAFMMANGPAPNTSTPDPDANKPHAAGMDNMPGMPMPQGTLPNTVAFPYGFPSPGPYRIFVQMKHGATVETGVFDANVAAPVAKN